MSWPSYGILLLQLVLLSGLLAGGNSRHWLLSLGLPPLLAGLNYLQLGDPLRALSAFIIVALLVGLALLTVLLVGHRALRRQSWRHCWAQPVHLRPPLPPAHSGGEVWRRHRLRLLTYGLPLAWWTVPLLTTILGLPPEATGVALVFGLLSLPPLLLIPPLVARLLARGSSRHWLLAFLLLPPAGALLLGLNWGLRLELWAALVLALALLGALYYLSDDRGRRWPDWDWPRAWREPFRLHWLGRVSGLGKKHQFSGDPD